MELGRCFFEPQNNPHGYAFQPSNGDTVPVLSVKSFRKLLNLLWLKSQSDKFSGFTNLHDFSDIIIPSIP